MDNQPLEDGYGTPATTWPGSGYAGPPPTQWTPERVGSKRKNVTELILQQVTLALQGNLANGPSFSQLNNWGQGTTGKIQSTWDSIIEAFTGRSDGGGSLFDLFNAASAQKRETTALAAGLAQLRADLTGNNNSGETLSVDMSDYGTDMPSVLTKFHDTGAGTVANDGDTLEFTNEDGRELFGYNVKPLLTDYFEVSLIVPRQAGTYFGSYGNRALYFIGRANADWSTFCLARLNGNRLRIGCVFGGSSTPTWFGSGNGSGPDEVLISPNSYMTYRGGNIGDDMVFQFLVNNRVVATFTDSVGISAIGEAYRWTGLGIENDRNDSVNRVPNISHFMANDNQPTPVVGTGARIVRISATRVAVSSGQHLFPANFFGLKLESTPNVSVNLVNGGYIVADAGWYIVGARVEVGTAWPDHVNLAVWVNGLFHQPIGNDVAFSSNALGGTQLPDSISASAPVYLNAGDFIQLGYESDGGTANAFTGESSGARTYFTLTKAN